MQNNFDDIRPYLNSEIQVVFRQLLGNDEVLAGASAVMPVALIDDLKRNYEQISDIDTFQERYMYPMLENLKKIKKTEITFSGTDNISQPAMFLSNHRDILTDSAFLQYVLVKNGLRTSEIAIGNNLMVKPWIAAAMRINKSFVVRRNITKGEQLSTFLELSGYIA